MNTRKLAVLFPGQGASYKGVLARSYPLYPQIARTFAEIDEVSRQEFEQTLSGVLFGTSSHNAGDVLQHCGGDPSMQLALYGVDVAIYKILESHGLQPDTLIGHSFGEIAALVCAGAFTVQEGAFIVAQRVKALQGVDTGNGYMTALSTDATRARKMLDLIGNQYAVIAVENHAEQTVISGTREIMDTLGEISRFLKISSVRLDSPYPFHSPLLQPAVNDFAARIRHLKQKPLHIPVFSPTLQRYYHSDDQFTNCLAHHLVLPLNFREAIHHLYAEGIQTFLECGALDTLTRLTKKILNVGARSIPTAPAQEDVDILVSLDPKQDEANSLATLLKELEQRGYVSAKSTAQHLADILLPNVEQEHFNTFWMVTGKQILARIKQDYETFMQKSVPLASVREELASTGDETPVQQTAREAKHRISTMSERPIQPATANIVASKNRDQLFQEIGTLYAETLEYPFEVFSDEIQFEAELGIDSIKQAELLARVSQRYQLPPRPANFRLGNYGTMGKVVDFVYSTMNGLQGKPALNDQARETTTTSIQTPSQIAEEFDEGEDEIAVVGMGLTVAGANDAEAFWKVLVDGSDVFTREESVRWNNRLFYSADQEAEDKTYQHTFVFITDFEPTPRLKQEIGIRADTHELTTLWLRHSLYQALEGVKRHDDDTFSLIIGYTADGSQHLEEASVYAGTMHKLEQILADLEGGTTAEKKALYEDIQTTLTRRYWRGTRNPSRFLPHQVGRNAMVGLLPEETKLQMVDTACSSSLYAIDIGMKDLLMGKQDIAICGGAFALGPRNSVLFAKLGGLSLRGEVRSLDKESDGVLFSDGAGVVVLKKLRRALQDGDRVLAVLKAFGASSDGKGQAVNAPSSAGQTLALRRALSQPGVDVDNLDWIAAHATGTAAGDLAEFTTLRKGIETSHPVYVTSHKSLIGHTGWAAGVVSLIEVILGMQKGLIPPQHRFTAPPQSFEIETSSLQIPTSVVPWPSKNGHARTASVSGFGFGGTNSHLLVQEYRTGVPRSSTPTIRPYTHDRIAIVGWSTHLPGLSTRGEVENWITGNGHAPESSFGTFYPLPSFQKVRLPPSTLRTIDRSQLMILECAHELRDQMKDFWDVHREKTGAFVGHMGATRSGTLYANRCYLDDIEHTLNGSDKLANSLLMKRALGQFKQEVKQLIPASNEDSSPGMMPNIIPARLANYFDLKGPNMAIDTGFASALTAFEIASHYLRTGEVELALVGGINGNTTPEAAYMVRDLIDAPTFELAEGAFLFAVTTETMALQSGLPILGYVDDYSTVGVGAAQGTISTTALAHAPIVCGSSSHRTCNYLGAEGALAVLTALLTRQQTILCKDGKETPATLLTLGQTQRLAGETGPQGGKGVRRQAPALPVQFLNNTEYAPGQALVVKRSVPVLQESTMDVVRSPIPFFPANCVVLTDQPVLLHDAEPLPEDLVVLSIAPVDGGQTLHLQIALPIVTPATVKDALARVGKPLKHVRVLTNLSKAAPAPECLMKEAASLMALHDLSFLVLQQCFETLSQGETSFISLFLRALPDGEQHPFTGFFGGLIKCAHLELPNSVTLGLFTSTESVQEGVQQVYLESAAHHSLPVVTYAQGTRKSILLQEANAELSEESTMQLDQNSVIMAVGGARGITAELLKAVARHCRSRLYLLGSNPLSAYPDEVFAGSDEEFGKRRPLYIREQRTHHSEKSIAAINRAFDRMIEARVARKNMSEMAEYCGREHVHYVTCDVTDREKVARVVAEIMQAEGKVDLLINAAGLNHPTPIRDKNFTIFRRVRDLKIQAYQNLKSAFKERQPRLWCNFGSLIGLGGQIGEVDYASANDFLASTSTYACREGTRTSHYPGPTTEFTIGWTLWGSAGLVANPLAKAYFERTGTYSTMTTEEGIHHFMREINQQRHVPAIIYIGEAERKAVNESFPGFFSERVQTKPEIAFYLDRILSYQNDEVIFERVFDLKRDSYLNNHLVNGYATLPGMFVTEIAAEAATQLVPGMHVIAFEDVQFKNFLRVYNEDQSSTKRIHTKIVDCTDEQVTVHVRILTDIVSPDGKILKRDNEHFEAKVVLRHEFPSAPYWEAWEEMGGPPVPDPYHAAASPVLLTNMFVSTQDTRLHPLGKRARYALNLPTDHQIFSRFLMPTMLFDGLARAGVLDFVEDKYIPLVAFLSIGRLDLYEGANDCQLAAQPGQIELYITPREATLLSRGEKNRFIAVHPDGKILVQINDMFGTLIGYIHRDTKQFFPPDHLKLTPQGEYRMSKEQNEAIARRFIQAWGVGNLEIVDELAAPDISVYYPLLGDTLHGREAFKQTLLAVNTNFPITEVICEEVFARDDKVLLRWSVRATHTGVFLGIPPTGKQVVWTGITVYHIVDGKIVEERGESNTLGVLQQIGGVPPRG